MQISENSLLDDYDYTFCAYCSCSILPYNNNIPLDNLGESSLNSYSKTLISYHHLNCEKCGLYIEIHPNGDDSTNNHGSVKIFICSNPSPDKYCLCYYCGLLYGINPNQQSINEYYQQQLHKKKLKKIKKQKQTQQRKLENSNSFTSSQKKWKIKSSSNDVNDVVDDVDVDDENENDFDGNRKKSESISFSSTSERGEHEEVIEMELDDDDEHDLNEKKSKIDESYLNVMALQNKLNLVQSEQNENNSRELQKNNKLNKKKHSSCPTSPNLRSYKILNKHIKNKPDELSLNNLSKSHTTNNKKKKKIPSLTTTSRSRPHSLRGSPLISPSTPSPRLLEKDLDDLQKKWHEFSIDANHHNLIKINKKNKNKSNTINEKLEKQTAAIKELEALQKRLTQTQNKSAKLSKLFRNGAYSRTMKQS